MKEISAEELDHKELYAYAKGLEYALACIGKGGNQEPEETVGKIAEYPKVSIFRTQWGDVHLTKRAEDYTKRLEVNKAEITRMAEQADILAELAFLNGKDMPILDWP